MKALFTSFHMLYCLSQNSKYFLRYVPVLIVLLCCCLSLLCAVVLVLSCICMRMIAPDIPSLPTGAGTIRRDIRDPDGISRS